MTTDSHDKRLQEILHAYLQAVDRGESPDRQSLLDANPDLREKLAEYFADASKLERLAASLRTAAFQPGPAMERPVLTPEKLADRIPQFEILELLGQGGMGAVYKARQKGLDRVVALKILPGDRSSDAGFVERFTREAKALARLNHPNIVCVYDVGQASDGLCYFVMEYIDGVNLRQAMRVGSISPREALAIVPQICDALQYAHDEGIVHRDIKPENVLLDKKGRVKIADFGLAKLLGASESDAALTGTHQVMGTLRYMAPEQMEGAKAIDHRADIYSLGVVFYELLTGEVPMGRFAPPSKKVRIDVRLDEVVLRALEREPEQRWQQASEVKTEVETISRNSHISPQPPADSIPLRASADSLGLSSKRFRLIASAAILALHVAAFVWPSIVSGGAVYRGWEWVASSAGAARPASLNANILFWIGLLLFAAGFWRSAIALGCASLMLTASDHAPFDFTLTFLAGIWMWVGSLVMLPIFATFGWYWFGMTRPWHIAGAVLAMTVALVIRFNSHYLEGPPRVAPFAAFFVMLFLNLVFMGWVYVHSLRTWMQTQMSPGQRVRGPAIGLIAVGLLGTVCSLALLIAISAVFVEKWRSPKGSEFSLIHLACMIGLLLVVAIRATTIIAGFRLHALRGRGLGLTVAVLASLPLDPVAIISIPVGIWVLAALLREDVAAAMQLDSAGVTTRGIDPVHKRILVAFALLFTLIGVIFGVVWATVGFAEAAVWGSLTWLAGHGLLLLWLPRGAARPALWTSWTLACVAVYCTLWMADSPHTSWWCRGLGYIDRHYWPYEGKSKCSVTLTPKDKTFRRVTITNEREIRRNGYGSTGVVNWSGPGWVGERTQDAFRVDLSPLSGSSLHQLLITPSRFRWQAMGPGRFESVGEDRPITVNDALDWLAQGKVEAKDEDLLRKQTEAWVNLIRLAQSDDNATGSWKRQQPPVGYLAFFVGREELDTSLKGAPFYWEDYVGTHEYRFKPELPILYVGVPVMLAVWLAGLLFLVRSRLFFRGIIAVLIIGSVVAIFVSIPAKKETAPVTQPASK